MHYLSKSVIILCQPHRRTTSAMDRLDVIRKIKQSNDKWSYEDIDKFIDSFIGVLKEEYENNGQVDMGEWGVFVYQKPNADKTKFGKVKSPQKSKGGIKDSRRRAPISLNENIIQ